MIYFDGYEYKYFSVILSIPYYIGATLDGLNHLPTHKLDHHSHLNLHDTSVVIIFD